MLQEQSRLWEWLSGEFPLKFQAEDLKPAASAGSTPSIPHWWILEGDGAAGVCFYGILPDGFPQ